VECDCWFVGRGRRGKATLEKAQVAPTFGFALVITHGETKQEYRTFNMVE
jgi:hypothetical protein